MTWGWRRRPRWVYLAIQVADGYYDPSGLPWPTTARRYVALRRVARRMPGHEPDLGDAMREVERALQKFTQLLADPIDEQDMVDAIADTFHRRGVPVTNGRVVGDAIVFDISEPAGHG